MAILTPYRREHRLGWYVDLGTVKLPDGTRRRFRCVRCEGRTLTQARRWTEREYGRLIVEGPRDERKEAVPTFDELFLEYLERSEKVGGRRGKAHGHWLFRQRVEYCGTHGDAGWISPRFGSRHVDDVNARDLDRFFAEMHDAGHTSSHARQVLSGMLKLAKRYGYIREVPELPPIVRRVEKGIAYTWEQMTHLLAVARGWSDADALVLLLLGLHGGLYQEEIAGLDRHDVDLRLGCLHVRQSAEDTGLVKPPKTPNRVRDIPLTPSLEDALRARLSRLPVGVQFLFFMRESGRVRRVKKEWIRRRVRPVLVRAGIPIEEPFRRMRRTFATECSRPRRRIPEALVVRWMGHAARHVTDARYVGDFPMAEQRELIAVLEAAPEQLCSLSVGSNWEPLILPKGGSGAVAES
ncbi:MAG: site-specific integrase [bacterium]